MSLNPERIKQQVIRAIDVNPTEIEIEQIIKVEKDGYFDEEEVSSKIKVVIYPFKSSEVQVSSDKIGTSYSSKKYNMVADYTSNLQVNPKKSIEFNCIEGHMKIKAVYPIVVKEIICGYECELERID
ncbi:MAG: hypothetical protein N4A57_02735 [Anaeromicrobium sp.]|jgi:hypothetical protein|uniref:hypothetical protein n=1 Tax=Anaeromicrobium sp. TaxID=1929132 RepID=UPI0025E4C489|nr:hypothetical protein [Anaeromicrobium sp.]MCT4593177.1 hypothetical protein [Anaeromicrobium sp.]